jgi:hypothetical protein
MAQRSWKQNNKQHRWNRDQAEIQNRANCDMGNKHQQNQESANAD